MSEYSKTLFDACHTFPISQTESENSDLYLAINKPLISFYLGSITELVGKFAARPKPLKFITTINKVF